MSLHYSVRFEGEEMKFHGEIKFHRILNNDYKNYLDEMIRKCKVGLIQSLKKWGYEPDQMVFSEFYFYLDGKEINFFEWNKP